MVRREPPAVLVSIVACLSSVISACGSGSTTLVSPSPLAERCALALTVSGASVSAGGGTGTLRIQTNRECSWALPPHPPWVKVAQPLAAQGPAEIAFTVDENRSTSPRAWEVVLGSEQAMIAQAAATCSWSLEPATISVGANGGEVRTTLTTEEFCSWELPPPVPWIAVAPTSGQGVAEITLRISPNPGATRSGRVEIAGASVEVAQREAPPPPSRPDPPAPAPQPPPRGRVPPTPTPPPAPDPAPDPPAVQCTFDVGPTNFKDVPAGATTIQVSVSTQPGCSWEAQTDANWLQIPSGMRTGSGRIDVSVSANGSAARSAVVVIAGRHVTVEQRAAIVCSFSVSPTTVDLPAAGGSGSVSVNSQSVCQWTVSGVPTWLTVSGASGAGSTTLKIAAAGNGGPARTAVLLVAGREVRVSQQQLPSCTYSVTPRTLTFGRRRANAKIELVTPSHCQWSATSSAAWITVPSGTRTGSGTIEVKVAEYGGSGTRSGVVTVIGQGFRAEVTVTQGDTSGDDSDDDDDDD